MNGGTGRPPRVLQVNLQVDEMRRDPEALLAAWPTIVGVAAAAREAGVWVSVLQAASRDAEFTRDGVRFHFVRERPPSAPRRRAGPWAAPARHRIARRAEAVAADLVHLHGLAFPLHARTLGRHLGLPVVAQDRANGVPRRWRRPVDRFGFRDLAAALFTTREQADPWIRAGVFAPDLPIYEVIGSSTDFTPGDREAARARTGLTGNPCLLWVGRLNAGKDPLTALEAVSRAARTIPELRLWCCYPEGRAPSPMHTEVRRRIAADPILAERTRLLGEVPHRHVQALCRAADLFLTASRREATGFALLEALACGLPPVATDIPSHRRLTGGSVGDLVPCGDARSLADAIVAGARRDPEAARKAARSRFERALSYEAVGRQLRGAYEAVVRG